MGETSLVVRTALLLAIALALAACVPQEANSPISVSLVDTGEQGILIRDVDVFDAASLALVPGQDVLVVGERIASIAPTGTVATPAGVFVIPGDGATLVPGLVDMHGHLTTTTGPSWDMATPNPEDNLRAYLYAGVTTIFDPGDSSADAISRRERVARGELLGPRIYTAGKIITDPDGHPRAMVDQLAPWWINWYLKPQVASGVSTPAEAQAEVDERIEAGVDAIKVVVDSIPLGAAVIRQPVLLSVVEQAHDSAVPVVAHIGTTADAIAAAENGVDLWVHGVYKERIADSDIARLAAYGIPMVTTSEVFDRYGRATEGPIQPTSLEAEMVSDGKLAAFYPPPDDFDLGALESWLTLMQQTREARLDNVGRLHEAGVVILAGSDTQSGVFPGAGLHRELETLVEAGLTPAEALQSATLLPARFLSRGREPKFGTVTAGAYADLVLVNGNPVADISALSDIRQVLRGGRLLQRDSLK
jgi:imidazolonepropionase-like amidohydrolase